MKMRMPIRESPNEAPTPMPTFAPILNCVAEGGSLVGGDDCEAAGADVVGKDVPAVEDIKLTVDGGATPIVEIME